MERPVRRSAYTIIKIWRAFVMKKRILSCMTVAIWLLCTAAITSVNATDFNNLKAKDVVSGGFFNGIILEDDSLWMWGESYFLGISGAYNEQLYPVKIMDDIKMVSGGRAHTLALKNNGDLYAFGGYGGYGLADIVGENHELYAPTKIMENIKYIDAGGGESCAITTSGELYIWHTDFDYDKETTSPQKMMDDVICATSGRGCFFAIKSDNSLWGWGDNSYGQLGDGTTESKIEPIKIMEDVKFVDVDNWGWTSVAAIKTDGSLWTWGLNSHGQLGNGGECNVIVGNSYRDKIQTIPQKIMDNIKDVNVTCWNMCAVDNSGNLYTWGSNYNGTNGNGIISDDAWEDNCQTPQKVLDNVSSAGIANFHGIAVKNDNSVWVWGAQPENFGNQISTPTKYTVDKSAMTISVGNILVGKRTQANLSVTPPFSTEIKVTWSSSDNAVATVDSNGYVTGKCAGEVTITAKTSNGLTASCVAIIHKYPFAIVETPTDQNGNAITSNTINAISKINIVLQRFDTGNMEPEFIVACYDENSHMIGFCSDKQLCDKDMNTVELQMPECKNIKTIKVLCWDNFNNMTPLAEVCMIE